MSASGKKAFEPLFEPKVSGFPKAQLNDLASVKRLITDKTVAVMLEPIQGEAGVWPATDQFLQELRALTQEHGLLLIVDEIQTGMGRTGKLFHYEHAGIEPDIMTLGKGIGGGVPLAALLATEHASCFEHGDQGGTFNGNPLMCAAGLAVLEHVASPRFLKSAADAGLFLESELQKLSARHGLGEVRGRGLLLALDLKLPIGGVDRGAGVCGRRAAELAAAGRAALHAGAQRHARGDRGDDRLPRRDPDQGRRGTAGGVIVDSAVIAGAIARRSQLAAGICDCFAVCVLRTMPGMTRWSRPYGRKIDAPVVALPSRSICAFAASFSA